MKYQKPRTKPEQVGATRLRRYMEVRGWRLKKTHGSVYSKDWPDFVAMHLHHGLRWIETKIPKGRLSQGQMKEFAIMHRYGQEVYVLRDERDYPLLFNPKGNWMDFI